MRRLIPTFAVILTGCLGLPKQPESESSHLSFAADFLDRDDASGAIPHLVAHVERIPDQPAIRTLLAGQYVKLGRWADAKVEYERAIDDYGDDRDSLTQVYTRLVQVAGELNDERLEQRSRGIGLMLVLQSDDAKTERLTFEQRKQTLTLALENLKSACEADRSDAVAHVYLGDCLIRFEQPSAARAAFAIARQAPPGELSDMVKALIPD